MQQLFRDKARQAKAESIGVNRGAVQRAEFIKAKDKKLAATVAAGDVLASESVREIKRREAGKQAGCCTECAATS